MLLRITTPEIECGVSFSCQTPFAFHLHSFMLTCDVITFWHHSDWLHERLVLVSAFQELIEVKLDLEHNSLHDSLVASSLELKCFDAGNLMP